MCFRRLITFAVLLALLGTSSLPAADPADGANPKSKPADDKAPAGVSAADSPETAQKRLVVAPGLKVDLWAAEPLIENVVNFSFDEQGRAYVVETGRRRTSVFDIRSYREWVDADLSFRTPWDRAEFLRTNVSQDNISFMRQMTTAKTGGFGDFNKDGRIDSRDLEVESERIKLVWDSTGSGVADKSAVFADGFNSSISGVAAGVLARRGEVYFTSIPDVWRMSNAELRMSNVAPSRPLMPGQAGIRHSPFAIRKLATGFGVHIAYGGHDMHGLKFGPDGKLYWTIADRGAGLTNLSRTLNPDLDYLLKFLPDTGAVFRSNPDGSELEVVAIGLRNPQELAFDDFGNLFTADNNADGGDKARWVHIVEGADYGWRYGWQHLPKLGAWNAEMLWGLAPSNTALSYPPPVAHIGHGPAGIAHYPGTGLPEAFRDCFFYADFPGGIRYFRLEPSGASFKVANAGKWLESNSPDEREGKLLWNLYPTDIEFGPDGGAYVLDWVAGWEKTGKGRIWRVHDPAVDAGKEVLEAKQLLAKGFSALTPQELTSLLGHANSAVRQAVEWEFVDRVGKVIHSLPVGDMAVTDGRRLNELLVPLLMPFSDEKNLRGQASSLRAVGQFIAAGAAKDRLSFNWASVMSMSYQLAMAKGLRPRGDYPAEVLLQFVRAVGNTPTVPSPLNLAGIFQRESNPQLRLAAAEALGKRASHPSAPPHLPSEANTALFELLRTNADQDATIRHAAVHALVRIGDTDALLAAAKDSSASVRLGACLALRRLMHPNIAQFLDDPDSRIVLEAARAIADLPIEPALPKLAVLLPSGSSRREEAPSNSKPQTPNPKPEQSLLTSAATRDWILRRALNAHFRLGQPTNAIALAAFAARADALEDLRIEALEMLADWSQPSSRDKITGLWRPLAPRDAKPARDALRPHLAILLGTGPANVGRASSSPPATPSDTAAEEASKMLALRSLAVALAAIDAVEKLAFTEAAPALSALIADTKQPADLRAAALRTLGHSAFRTPHSAVFAAALKLAQTDSAEALRKEATRLTAESGGAGAVTQLVAVLAQGTLGERQSAFQSLASIKDKAVDDALRKALTQLLGGKLPTELHLDVLEAAARRTSPSIKEQLTQFEAKRGAQDHLAKWRECLTGGDAKAGRALFFERQEAACARCHKVAGEGGDVGPDLAGLLAKKGREYLLESLVLPNRVIAPGFESLLVVMKNGQSFAGLVKGETGEELVLNSPEDGLLKLKKSEIAKRSATLSPMPETLIEVLTKRELRDLVEFLATTK